MSRKFYISLIKAGLIFLSGVPFTLALAEDVDTAWVRRYNGPGNGDNKAVAIAVDDSGNVYVTGSSFDSTTAMVCGYSFLR